MMKMTTSFAALGGAMLFMAATAAPAYAIKCDGHGNQYNSVTKSYIPSSWCGDKLIARIANKPFKGPNGVLLNVGVKEEACRFAGHDIRINHLCAGNLSEDNNGRRFN